MTHPDLLKTFRRLDELMAKGEQRVEKQRQSGEADANTAADYAYAEHAAQVIVAYTRAIGQELEGTGLLVVPPPPAGLQVEYPDGFTWPTGWTTGPLATDNERKVAARAIAAEVQRLHGLALNDFRCDRVHTEMTQSAQSAHQSMLKAETQELLASTAYGPVAGAEQYDHPDGSGQGPRRTPPPPPRRR